MLWFILSAAMLGMFAAAVVTFFKLSLIFFDYVIERMPGWFQALKVLILRGAKVIYGTLTKDRNTGVTKLYTEPKEESVNFVDLDPTIQTALNKSQMLSNGTKMVEERLEPEVERELRRA
ncbi:MAG: hypothetical protein K5685_11195 [Bacteroidales bacterium]|nr:hypothetical protein [Bacteroidales bacterium]